jgi:poly(hydroxyalkanoate) depolymerase family esterase
MMLNQDIIREATRLTRGGRLVEATALLQRMLRGETSPGVTFGTASEIAPARREPLIIDATANVIKETDRPHPRVTSTQSHMLGDELLRRTKKRTTPELRARIKRAPPSTRDILPEGAKFIEGTHSNPAGSRTYRLFIPSCYHGQPLPLVVMLHGCTQSPDDFAAGTRMNFIAEEQNCFVVYPAQPSEANQAKCWNWFRTADQQRGSGEPSLIAGITRQIMRDYSVDQKRVYVGGLSAGAAAAAIMGATYNDLYAAIGIHSGLACGAALDLPSAFVAMRQGGLATSSRSDDRQILTSGPTVPTIVFHGDRDMTVHPSNADHILEQSTRATRTQKILHRGRVPGGHAYTRTVHTDASGREIFEHWSIHGAGHAWSGGSPAGSYTDPRGPDATREMLRFFLEHSLTQ